MVGHYATPESDITITRHLPPPEDDSAQDVSTSFVIPPQADASNLLDQNYDDFFSGPGFVTLSTPALPRHLTNTLQSLRKVTGPQTPAVTSSLVFGQTFPKYPTTELELPDDRTELQETHTPSCPSPLLSQPAKQFTSMGPHTSTSLAGTTSIADPGSSRPGNILSESGPDARIFDGLGPNAALSMASTVTAKATGTHPGIQSTSTSAPPRHSTNAQPTQIPRQHPIPASQKKNKGLAPSHGAVSTRPNPTTSRLRSESVPNRETTTSTQNRVGGGAAKRLKSTHSNRGVGNVKGRIESDPASSHSRGNVDRHAPPTGSEHPDPDLLGSPAESCGAVTQSLVTKVLPPPPECIQSRFSPVSGGAYLSGPLPSLDPPRTREDHAGTKITRDLAEEEQKDDDRVTVSQQSPSKTVRECRYDSESSDWNNNGIRPNPEPTPRASIAVSPMRPSKKRVASAGQESDTEPGGAWPDEWEKRYLITESNREGEVRGGGEGKKVQQARVAADGEKPRTLLQPLRKGNGVASSSLTLTRRLRAKAVRESPRVRKLRDKLPARVVAGGRAGRRSGIGSAPENSRGRHAMLDACGFPENVGASTTASVGTVEGKGSDRTSSGETTGPRMPYNGDNEEGGVTNRRTGSGAGGGPSFRSTLKRKTAADEFRFELAARSGNGRGWAAKEKPRASASRNSREDGRKGNSRKRPKLSELGGAKSGVVDSEEHSSSSRLSEAKDHHHDQTGSHASAWKGSTRSRSNNSSMGRSRGTPLMVPEAFRFSTEQRAKDREKFDEGVRVKQKEKERRLEEDRAAKAVEDEREIKEMRKRAVPKANSIPEWYTTMPKRKAA